jgi:hypothetical protein
MADWLSSFAGGVSPRMEGGSRWPTSRCIFAASMVLLGCGSAAGPLESSWDTGAALDRAVGSSPSVPAIVAVARDGELLLLRAVSDGPPTDTCAAVGLLATSLLQQRLSDSGVSRASRLGAILPGVEPPLGALELSALATHATLLPSFSGAVVFEPPTPESVLDAIVGALPDEEPAPRRPEASVANLYLLERALAAGYARPLACRRRSPEAREARAAIPSPVATADALARALSLADEAALPLGARESLGDEPLWTGEHEEPGTRAFAALLPRDHIALFVIVPSERFDPEPLARDLLAELRGAPRLDRPTREDAPPSRALRHAAAPESWRGRWELVPDDAARAERELPAGLRTCLELLVLEPIGSNVRISPRCLGPFVLVPTGDPGGGFAAPHEGLQLRPTAAGPELRLGAFAARLRRAP